MGQLEALVRVAIGASSKRSRTWKAHHTRHGRRHMRRGRARGGRHPTTMQDQPDGALPLLLCNRPVPGPDEWRHLRSGGQLRSPRSSAPDDRRGDQSGDLQVRGLGGQYSEPQSTARSSASSCSIWRSSGRSCGDPIRARSGGSDKKGDEKAERKKADEGMKAQGNRGV